MAASIHRRESVTPAINVTSMADVTFLILIFFVLTSHIVYQESTPLIVPSLTDSKTHELDKGNRVVVNVVPPSFDPSKRAAKPLYASGDPIGVKVGTQTFSLGDLAGITAALEQARAKNPKVRVLLRADAALYYRAVQPVMSAIAAAGIAKVELVAAMPKD